MGNVDTNPEAVEPLRHLHCRPAAAEGIKNQITFVGTGLDNAFEKGFGLLGRIAQVFLSSSSIDVSPVVLKWDSGHLIGKLHHARHPGFTVNDLTCSGKLRDILV
jgi:hypothetical protein